MADILFLTLRTFSATGGIEKVCQIAGKSLYEYGIEKNKSILVCSMHDADGDADGNPYFPAEILRCYSGNKAKAFLHMAREGRRAKTVILSHLNLLPVAWMIKKISPSVKIILFAHGFEIWNGLSSFYQSVLKKCELVVAVSSYTRNRITELYGLNSDQCQVLNNCLDPYLDEGPVMDIPALKARYGYAGNDKILFMLARISSSESYKGYDMVLEAMADMGNDQLHFLLGGGYDEKEKENLESHARSLGIENRLIIAGFIPKEELAAHFQLADIYVMPSREEGFGIVFIEALNYGTPVIAGNADGSTDALMNGKLGLLVDPQSKAELADAITRVLKDPKQYFPDHKLLIKNFGYESYKSKLNNLLNQFVEERNI